MITFSEIPTKYKIAGGTFILVGAFAAGRWTVPEKIKIVTQTVEVTKKDDTQASKISKNTHKKTVVQSVKKPDGEEITTTTSTEDDIDKSQDIVVNKDEDTSSKTQDKEITANQQKVTVLGMFGANMVTGQFEYGLSISKPILGPFTIGLWGLYGPPMATITTTTGSAGLSVGWTF